MPQRIQRSRQRGWRMPEGAVYVGRPTIWGNPYRVGSPRGPFGPTTPAIAVRKYRSWLLGTDPQPRYGVDRAVILNNLHQLTGRDLCCWCPLDLPCHADVLIELARASAVTPVTGHPDQTHSARCWRWHHACAIARVETLATALGDALSRYDRTWKVDGPDGPEHFTARPVSTVQLDAWQRALDVAGADVTPSPAAPATTTTDP
jgi:hypothetical protein